MLFLRLSVVYVVTIAISILACVWMFGDRFSVPPLPELQLDLHGERDPDDRPDYHFEMPFSLVVAHAVAEGNAHPAVKVLTKALRDRDDRVRAAAAWALGKMGAKALTALPELNRAADDRDQELSHNAMNAIDRITKKAKGETTEDADPFWTRAPGRTFVSAEVQTQEPDTALKALIAALNDPDSSVRQEAVRTLGKMGDKAAAAIPALTETLKDKEVDVRGAAAMALGRMGKKAKTATLALAALLADSERDVRCAAALTLSRIGKDAAEAIPSLVKMAKSDDKYVQVYACCALAVLDEKGEPHVRVLAEALTDAKVEVRGSAAYVLGELGSHYGKSAIPSLARALKDQDKNVRMAVARALGEMTSEAKIALPSMIEALKDTDTGVRSAVAMAIGEVGPSAKDAVPALIDTLKDKEVEVRGSAVFALGEIGPAAAAAITALARVVTQDEDAEVRRAAALAIGKISE